MSETPTDDRESDSPGLTTAVMRGSLSQRMFAEPAAAVSIERFRVLRVVGQGAVGAVYEAYDPRLDRRLALKLVRGGLPEKAQQLLLDEARTLAKVSHPNVVTVYDAGMVDGRVFIAMEFVSGGALSEWLGEARRTTEEILDAFTQAGRGLAAAHGVGVVHRDFKPANVMRNPDGGVKVGDFGLARALAAVPLASREDSPRAGSGSSGGLVTSHVAGTPAYMAPEALDGSIDPRSDQFSFCVALWEALFGERPPAGVAALERGEALPQRAVERNVPRRVVAAISRGLSADPQSRWPSMEALLSALEPRTAVRVWQGLAILAVGGVVGSAVVAKAGDAPCELDGDSLAGVWDDDVRGRARAAFEAQDLSYGEETWSRVTPRLDAYAGAWESTRQQACEASLVRHERSAEAYDLAVACLEERRASLAALTSLMTEADTAVVDRAVAASDALPEMDVCREPDELRTWGLLPPDPRAKEAMADVRRGLAEVSARIDLGQLEAAKQAVEPLVTKARDLGISRLLAEALDLRARVAHASGDPTAAAAQFEEALVEAARGGHERYAAGMWVSLVGVTGRGQEHLQQALSHALAARVAIERVGGDPMLTASLEHALGATYMAADDLEQAEQHHRRGLELRREHLPAGSLKIAESLNSLAGVLMYQRRSAEAIALLLEVCKRYEEAFSPSHPRVASIEGNLARTLASGGQMEEAIVHLRRAIAVHEATLGPEHPKTLEELGLLGTLLGQVGKPEEGIAVVEDALTKFQAYPDHPSIPPLLNNLGGLYDSAGRPEDSMKAHLRLREHLLAQGKRETATFAMNDSNLALMQTELGEYDAAEKNFHESIEVYERVFGPEHPELWRPNAMLANLLRKTDRFSEALPYAERAVALLDGATSDPNEIADAELGLARSRWAVGRHDAETVALARKAAERWRALGLDRHAEDAETWVAEHPVAP